MKNLTRNKSRILHPREVMRNLSIEKNEYRRTKKEEEIIKKYLNDYKSLHDYNKTNSKFSDYFNLCKRILTDTISDELLCRRFFQDPNSLTDFEIINSTNENPAAKSIFGTFWPKRAHTMIGLMRLENLQFCVEDIIKNNVKGDLIETGVWRGGATIFMRIILKKYEILDKIVHVADSFEGFPQPNPEMFPEDLGLNLQSIQELKVGLNEVKNNFKMYGVLDSQVQFIKGFFENTMKTAPIEKLSLLRLDSDMFSSTLVVLENLYDKLSSGGYLIVDDYFLKGCKKATDDFRLQNNISEPLQEIDPYSVFWKKTS